jgi:hypothetical protein
MGNKIENGCPLKEMKPAGRVLPVVVQYLLLLLKLIKTGDNIM